MSTVFTLLCWNRLDLPSPSLSWLAMFHIRSQLYVAISHWVLKMVADLHVIGLNFQSSVGLSEKQHSRTLMFRVMNEHFSYYDIGWLLVFKQWWHTAQAAQGIARRYVVRGLLGIGGKMTHVPCVCVASYPGKSRKLLFQSCWPFVMLFLWCKSEMLMLMIVMPVWCVWWVAVADRSDYLSSVPASCWFRPTAVLEGRGRRSQLIFPTHLQHFWIIAAFSNNDCRAGAWDAEELQRLAKWQRQGEGELTGQCCDHVVIFEALSENVVTDWSFSVHFVWFFSQEMC